VRPPKAARTAAAALAAAACLALAGCQLPGSATPAQTPHTSPHTSQGSTVNTSDFSTLDTAGVDKIRTELRARLDLSSGKLLKSAVGVSDTSYGPEINTQNEGKINLTIVAPAGEISGETDRIRFNTTNIQPDFSEITYFLTADSPEEFFALIRDGVGKYGIDGDSAEGWISSASADPQMKSDFSLTSGTSTGLDVNYDLRYDGSKDVQVIIVHVRPVE